MSKNQGGGVRPEMMETQKSGFNAPASSTQSMGSTMNMMSKPAKEAAGGQPRSAADLRQARESRATEALKMKDEQLRILSEQNSQLLGSLDKVEEEANAIQMAKLAVEEENRTLRDSNFEVQSKARAADIQLKKTQTEISHKEKQLKILTDQNAELLRLLETEEAQTAKLAIENEKFRGELEQFAHKYGVLLTTAKTHEDMAARAAREGQLRAEEVRLLRAETEHLKTQNAELKMKTQVELEALQEQLRVRKEKQYQLLEKLQGQEEAKRQAEDQVAGMEDKLRMLHGKNIELETQLQVEIRAKRSQEDAAKKLTIELENSLAQIRELKIKIDQSEQERLRMEAEARDSGEQLREMAEKVFQLLERLKLAELGKTKAMEALRKKEQEMIAMKKKNSRLIKESTKEGKARVKAELDKKVLEDQTRALKKHNNQMSQRCREEVKLKLKEHEERKEAEEKLKTLGGRLSFLLNKMQADEEAKVIQKEEAKKMEAQIKSLGERISELTKKLDETGESNRIITQAMRLKQDELSELKIRYEAMQKLMQEMEDQHKGQEEVPETLDGEVNKENPNDPDVKNENNKTAAGRGRFFIESKPALGMLLIKGKKVEFREWLDKRDVNSFLRRAQKTTKFKEMVIERMAQMYGLLMVEEEERGKVLHEVKTREDKIDHLNRKISYLQDRLGIEEEAKRRTLLRYVHAVKAASILSTGNADTPSVEHGRLQLPESNITDEEVHAVAALLKGNASIVELSLRNNLVTDEGARAIAAVLSGKSSLRTIDFRGNCIGKQGIRAIAEALERSERVRHVYVHAGGKIEALGTQYHNAAENTGTIGPIVSVETVCVVDCRECIAPEGDTLPNRDPLKQQDKENQLKKQLEKGSPFAAVPKAVDDGSRPVPKRGSAARKKAEQEIEINELERKKTAKEARDADTKEATKNESRWHGRMGGMEIRPQGAAGDTLPAITNQGGNSPNRKKEDADARLLRESPLLSPAKGGKVHGPNLKKKE